MRKYLLPVLFAGLALCCNGKNSEKETSEPAPQPRIVNAEPPPRVPQTGNSNLETITIASFNIQIFGPSKRKKTEIMDYLADIVNDYDVIAIQEIRGKDEQTAPIFLNHLNKSSDRKYAFVVSPRIGAGNHKEQYAFFYDTSNTTFLGDSYVYKDAEDKFAREPFVAYFRSGNFDYVLINIHTKPENATSEIDALEDVVKDAQEHFPGEGDFIVLGDFNADNRSRGYYDENAPFSPQNRLRWPQRIWIIPNNVDTTVSPNNDFTYDRIVVMNATREDWTGEFGVRRFDAELGLVYALAKKISDHYLIFAIFHTRKDTD